MMHRHGRWDMIRVLVGSRAVSVVRRPQFFFLLETTKTERQSSGFLIAP